MKKRVLYVGEFSQLSTGYSRYAHELLTRLHNSGKFEVAELARYASPQDPRLPSIPWRVYPNLPANPDEQRVYESNQTNQFGEWKFEAVCLDFAPQYVLGTSDIWMDSFIVNSIYRPYFNFVWMPTCDSSPSRAEWLSDYSRAEAVFGYTDWSAEQMRKEGNGHIKVLGAAPAGANLAHFYVSPNKKLHKQQWGLPEDSFIVGFVARNQLRKLFPDLMKAFRKFLDSLTKEQRVKTYLYLHSCWPDVGWNIPQLIIENGLSHHVLMTYLCRSCGLTTCSPYKDSKTACVKCGQQVTGFPNSQSGIDTQLLGHVYNIFDLYVQFCTNEGQGIPQVEAAACGVPVFAVDYSAMADVVRKVGGTPLEVQTYWRDSTTYAYKACPSESDFVQKLYEFYNLSASEKRKLGFKARMGVEKYYSWDETAQKWANAIDSLPLKTAWNAPPRLHQPNMNVPQGLNNEQLVNWALVNVAGRPDLLNTNFAMRLSRDVLWEASSQLTPGLYFNDASMIGMTDRVMPFNRDQFLQVMLGLAHTKNHWEQQRWLKYGKGA